MTIEEAERLLKLNTDMELVAYGRVLGIPESVWHNSQSPRVALREAILEKLYGHEPQSFAPFESRET